MSVLLAVTGESKRWAFGPGQVTECKQWLHEQYENCSNPHKKSLKFCVEQIVAGKEIQTVYTYDSDDFLHPEVIESLECVDWFLQHGYISLGVRDNVLNALENTQTKFIKQKFRRKKRKHQEKEGRSKKRMEEEEQKYMQEAIEQEENHAQDATESDSSDD